MAKQADFSRKSRGWNEVGKILKMGSNHSNQVGTSWNRVGILPTAKVIEISIKINTVGEVGKKCI